MGPTAAHMLSSYHPYQVRRTIFRKHGPYWGTRYPFVNRADAGWAKVPSYSNTKPQPLTL